MIFVLAINQEKALVGAFSVITNLRMELFEASAQGGGGGQGGADRLPAGGGEAHPGRHRPVHEEHQERAAQEGRGVRIRET